MACALLDLLEEEVTCAICLTYLEDPVTIDCGHIFCRGCVAKVHEFRGPALLIPPSCPLCKRTFRKEHWKPAWQAASMVRNIRKVKEREERAAGGETLCGKHGEKLHFHCEDDGQLLCIVCRESREHRPHEVTVIEEAAQTYREKILHHIQLFKKQRDEILDFQSIGKGKIQMLLTQTEADEQKVKSEFRQIHQFLERQECLLLGHLKLLSRWIREGQLEYVARFSEEFSCLGTLIAELEEKNQQPDIPLLEDINDLLRRCQREKFLGLDPISLAFEKRSSNVAEKILHIQRGLKEFRASQEGIVAGLPDPSSCCASLALSSPLALPSEQLLQELECNSAGITLDPDTAPKCLAISGDGKRAINTARFCDQRQKLPDHPKRFDSDPFLLGREGFAAGRHSWVVELEVGKFGAGAVGVARESVKRKGGIVITPEEGFWALGFSLRSVWPLTANPTQEAQRKRPRKLRVSLDWAGGRVTFSNAETRSPVYTFSASFSEKIFPFFGLWKEGTQVTVSP